MHQGRREMRRSIWSIPFCGDGGPLLVLPKRLLSDWHGASPVRVESSSESNGFLTTDDFGRALAATEPVDTISVGSTMGIVIGARSDPYGVRWLSVRGIPDVFLINPIEAENGFESAVVKSLSAIRREIWIPLLENFPIDDDCLVLFAAVDSGAELELIETGDCAGFTQGIPWHIIPGIYRIDLCSIQAPTKPQGSPTVICRFQRAAPD